MKSIANFMWRTQDALHSKNSPIVPALLLLVAVSLVVYSHVTYAGMQQDPDRRHNGSPLSIIKEDHLKTFLCMILIQMVPLAILEVKIMSCADPVGLFCKFAVPVTLIHVVFLAMRFTHHESYDELHLGGSAVGLVGALITLYKGFHWSPMSLFTHKSVWTLVGFCILAGCSTQWIENVLLYRKDSWIEMFKLNSTEELLETATNYMEIVAFVPALWMVVCEDKSRARVQVEEIDSKRTSTAFFLFLVGFYLSEDLINAVDSFRLSKRASAAHCLHFLLLLDFACYILAHIYNPEKLMGGLRKWLPIDLSYEV